MCSTIFTTARFQKIPDWLDLRKFPNTNVISNWFPKGQIKPKADWRAIYSPKKQTNKFGFFAMTVHTVILPD